MSFHFSDFCHYFFHNEGQFLAGILLCFPWFCFVFLLIKLQIFFPSNFYHSEIKQGLYSPSHKTLELIKIISVPWGHI